jgi:hypothetical protein
MLYKQYTDLCEPGGVSFLSFGVDPAFNGAVDGLILLDLAQVKPRKRQRYLESRAAACPSRRPIAEGAASGAISERPDGSDSPSQATIACDGLPVP